MFSRRKPPKSKAPAPAPPASSSTGQDSSPLALLIGSRGALTGSVAAKVFAVPESLVVEAKGGKLDALYELESRPLGQGQMSTVYKATRKKDGESLTLKVLNLSALMQSERATLKAASEVTVLRQLPPHPHIVRLLEIA